MSKILPRFPQWISPRISLPVANLGEIPGKIVPRFLPPWICSSARILARFAVAFRRDFGRRDYCFPARILARFAAGSRRDFGRREFRFPARFPPGRKIPAAKISPGSRRDSRRDRGGIPPRSRFLFYKGVQILCVAWNVSYFPSSAWSMSLSWGLGWVREIIEISSYSGCASSSWVEILLVAETRISSGLVGHLAGM